MVENKMFCTLLKKEIREDERTITIWANRSDVVDRSGHVIDDDAWELERFLSNPVVCAFHRYDRPPVAKALWARVVPGKGLMMKIKFASTDEGMEFYQLYSENILNAFSVGFSGKEYVEAEDMDSSELKKYIRNGITPNTIFKRVELFEVSCVAVPDNYASLVAKSIGSKSKELQDYVESIKKSPEYIELISEDETKDAPQEKAKIVGHIDLDFSAMPKSLDGAKELSLENKCADCEDKEKQMQESQEKSGDEDNIEKIETTEEYHHIPVRDAGDFVDDSFKTIDITDGIKAVIGKLKSDPEGSTHIQKYLFDVDKFTMEEAKAWVEDHKKAMDKPKKPCKKEDGCDGECTGEDCEEYDSCDEEMKKSIEDGSVEKKKLGSLYVDIKLGGEDIELLKSVNNQLNELSEKGIIGLEENEEKSELDEIIESSIKGLEDELIESKEIDARQDLDSVQKTIDLFNSMKINNLTNEMKEQIKKQYGEEFDISSVKVEPYGFEYKIFCKFIGCKVKEIFTNDFFIPTVERGNYLSAIKTLLKNETLLDQRAFTQNGCEVPLKYSTIKLNSKRSDEFLITGTQFYKSTDDEPFILQFYPVWGGMIVDIYCSKDKNKIAKTLFVDSVKWVEKNNFLRGEKFSVSGEFIERKEIGWDDVIYSSEKDKETIKKNVEKLSESSPSRGMMLVGPPGNGKTTLGKAMMNKMDSTFIWASSKDFEWGADYTLGIGFEMARKLAPSVFFIEDIDGWLNAYTVDLLKTEMDGIRDNKGVLTILTSNFPENMPDALIDRPGRFHHIINFSLPNKENRIKLLKFFAENADKESIEKFADMTEGYSGSHLRELVDFAKMISEDEEISIDEALMKSFEQMKEQRQLIHDIKNEPRKKEFVDVNIKNKSDIDFEIKETKTEEKTVIDFEIKEAKKENVDFYLTKEEAQEIIKNSIINVSKEMQSIEDLVDERIKRAKGIIF